VIGGVARPAIEGWILALLGVGHTDDMSRKRTLEELKARGVDEKHPAAYVAVVEASEVANLPSGCDSLHGWLESAKLRLGEAVHGS
jgi:hypothetical protein